MWKSLEIKSNALHRLKRDFGELYTKDTEGAHKSITPGEWILIRSPEEKKVWLGFAHPFLDEKWPSVRVLCKLMKPPQSTLPQEYIKEKLHEAVASRKLWKDLGQGARIVYGESDGLPGVVVDFYKNASLIQINTAGFDLHREMIKSEVEMLTKTKAYLVDFPKARAREGLPDYGQDLPEELKVEENGFQYILPKKILQKVGWYYDHRDNRLRFERILSNYNLPLAKGVDLFCYAGAWGMHGLRGGVHEMTFVDQASMDEVVMIHGKLNGFEGKVKFERSHVFDWLDQKIHQHQTFEVVCCDPPAFAKSPKDKAPAMEGYKKLHRKVLRIASDNGIIAFGSCTRYVNLVEFQQTILEAAERENKKLQLLEIGIQGKDHGFSSIQERSNYIKCLIYKVKS